MIIILFSLILLSDCLFDIVYGVFFAEGLHCVCPCTRKEVHQPFLKLILTMHFIYSSAKHANSKTHFF